MNMLSIPQRLYHGYQMANGDKPPGSWKEGDPVPEHKPEHDEPEQEEEKKD